MIHNSAQVFYMLLYSDITPAQRPSHYLDCQLKSESNLPWLRFSLSAQWLACLSWMDEPTCQRRKSEGFCLFGGRQRGRKYSSAFKALTLPPCAFVFCPGSSATVLLKACVPIAALIYVHETKSITQTVGGGLCVRRSHHIQWTTANSVSFSLCQSLCCHNLEASILPSCPPPQPPPQTLPAPPPPLI